MRGGLQRQLIALVRQAGRTAYRSGTVGHNGCADALWAWRRLTYGAVLVLHAISTLSSYRQYLSPFEGSNLLFFAAWPMLAACVGLYLLRDHDTLFTVPPRRL